MICAGPSAVVGDDPVLIALADAGQQFAVPMQAFGELIDGCVADVNGACYATFDDLLPYCRCVAGSIGRLSLGVFGAPDMRVAEPLADSLGVALQLTNILRDIREDYRNGRVYLSAEDLDRFGCTLKPADGQPDPAAEPAAGPAEQARLVRVIEFEASRARDWYATGMQLLPLLDGRSAACTGAMAGIYRKLLDRIAAEPAAVLHGRVSLSPREKALVAVRSLARPVLARRPRVARPAPAGPPAPARSAAPAGPAPSAGPAKGHTRERAACGRAAARGGDRRRPGRDHRGDRAGGGRGRRHAAGGTAAPGRRHHLVQPRGAGRRHRPARIPALLHGLPRAAGAAGDDRIGPHPGPVRRHRPVTRRYGAAPPEHAAWSAAHGRRAGPLPDAVAGRAGPGDPCRSRHADAEPGRSRAGCPAARRLAGGARSGRADPPGTLGSVHRLLPQHRRRRRVAGARHDRGEDRAAR